MSGSYFDFNELKLFLDDWGIDEFKSSQRDHHDY